MFKLSKRCARLRADAVDIKPLNRRILPQHVMLFEEGLYAYIASGGTGAHSRIAAGLANVLEKAPPLIGRSELLVGYNYADTPYPEFWQPDASEACRQLILDADFTAEQYENHLKHHAEVFKYYQFDRQVFDYSTTHTITFNNGEIDFLKDFSKAELEMGTEWAAIGRSMTDNHTIVDYAQVLELGFSGLKARVEAFEAQNGYSDMYDAMKRVCDAACTLGARYADHAEALLSSETNPSRRAELAGIAACCRRVPALPARSFYEAVQSLVFAHYINTWEDGINANSLGRLDQLLYPYYHADIQAGRITREQAFELICCLWIKFYRDYDVQQSCIGGCKTDGSDAINALSWMMLDATEALGFVRCISVRFTSRTDPAFIRRALEVVGHLRKGVPFFFNDDVLIPALVSKGVSLEDARQYSQIGCVETVLPGLCNPHAVSGESNLLKAMEYTFGNGRSLFDPQLRPGLATGELAELTDFARFKAAVYDQMENILDITCRKVALWSAAAAKYNPKPVKSLLTRDCVENGRDFNARGARYDYYQIMLGGIINLADALLSVRTIVYEEQLCTLDYMKAQLESNFPNEAFRQLCLHHAAKFGNDDDAVDSIAAELIDFCCDVLERMEAKYQLRFHAQPFTFLWMIDHGNVTAASPDGRRRGENIAYSASPMQGRDMNGLTAVLNSLAKLPSKRCPGTISAIVEAEPLLFTDSNIPILTDILLTAAERGLSNVQFNTVDVETLLDAQLHPEKHNNLAVRVSGFSQKFNLLDRPLQDHIIGRTKHKCL